MSGHSHAKTILHKKQITDAKRGKIFSKLAREISVATREGGGDPEINSKLRLVIEKARQWNLPKDNIERAIKRGTGELAGEQLESVLFEAYGPGGIAIIIEGITDNKNRTLGEVKQIFNQNNGKLAGSGSVKWMFERKGCLEIQSRKYEEKKREDLELLAIEAGAEDIYWHNNILDVYTKPEELEKVKKNLEEKGIQAESAALDWVAKEQVGLDEKSKEACQKLFGTLDENDAVQEIYSNIKLP
jgi:YebC/PmpR family DNA-binding regulatory protein